MQREIEKLFTNNKWEQIFNKFFSFKVDAKKKTDYMENVCISYVFNPCTDHFMTKNKNLFDIRKAAAMYFWYKKASAKDSSIINYFEEYKHCIDDNHKEFNSNYGIYAYKRKGLKKCIDELIKNQFSRQACFCINNNAAMGENSIDKLCTNTIQFFIRTTCKKAAEDVSLKMLVQMRSSNFLTLLPYDAFMFSVFYWEVYHSLKRYYTTLKPGTIHIQVASLHCYRTDLENRIYSGIGNDDIPDTILNFERYNKKEVEQFLKSKL